MEKPQKTENISICKKNTSDDYANKASRNEEKIAYYIKVSAANTDIKFMN